MFRLQVHPEAGQGENLLGSLLALGDLALLLVGGGQGREPGHLIHVGALESVLEPVGKGLHWR